MGISGTGCTACKNLEGVISASDGPGFSPLCCGISHSARRVFCNSELFSLLSSCSGNIASDIAEKCSGIANGL